METLSGQGHAEIPITAQMVPSLRLIGYYYDQQGALVSDSAWVDVADQCETAVKVSAFVSVTLETTLCVCMHLHHDMRTTG